MKRLQSDVGRSMSVSEDGTIGTSPTFGAHSLYPKKRQQLKSVVPAVQAKPASTAKVPPPTASWLTGALSEPKRGGRGSGWSRSGGCGGGPVGTAKGVVAMAAANRVENH